MYTGKRLNILRKKRKKKVKMKNNKKEKELAKYSSEKRDSK